MSSSFHFLNEIPWALQGFETQRRRISPFFPPSLEIRNNRLKKRDANKNWTPWNWNHVVILTVHKQSAKEYLFLCESKTIYIFFLSFVYWWGVTVLQNGKIFLSKISSMCAVVLIENFVGDQSLNFIPFFAWGNCGMCVKFFPAIWN